MDEESSSAEASSFPLSQNDRNAERNVSASSSSSSTSTSTTTSSSPKRRRIIFTITPPFLLALAVLCLVLTGYASWACSFVTHDTPSSTKEQMDAAVLRLTASTAHTTSTNPARSPQLQQQQQQQQQQHYRISSSYGLWTLQDDTSNHHTPQCHLWYVFFVGAQLDGWIKVAQSCSMTAQVLGLMVTVGVLQHCVSSYYKQRFMIGVGTLWALLCVASMQKRQQFNSWTLFFGSTYLVLLWLVQPTAFNNNNNNNEKRTQPPRPSQPPQTEEQQQQQTSISTQPFLWQYRLSYTALIIGLLTAIATLSMRQSAVCTCATMVLPMVQGQALEFGACDTPTPGSDDSSSSRNNNNNNERHVHSMCRLGRAGWVMVVSGVGWILLGLLLRLWLEQQKQWQSTSGRRRPSSLEPEMGLEMEDSDEDEPPVLVPYGKRRNADVESDDTHDDDASRDDSNASSSPLKLTGRQRCRLYSYRLCLGMFLLIYLAIILLLVLSHRQNNQAAKLPDTSPNFLTDTVCAFLPADTPSFLQQENISVGVDGDLASAFVTFPSKEQAVAAGYQVAHCGACGYCSNPTDITTYINTRTTIADTAKTCGKYTVMGRGREWLSASVSSSSSSSHLYDCLEERIGFTPECTQCWVDNMKTTARRCMMTCVSTVLNGFMGQNNMEHVLGSTTTASETDNDASSSSSSSHWMNQCFFCDEKQSGPAFVQCSGVARRRLGIASEISRDPREQCAAVDWDWTKVELHSLFGTPPPPPPPQQQQNTSV